MGLFVLLGGKSSHKLSTVSRENLWQGDILRTKTAKDYEEEMYGIYESSTFGKQKIRSDSVKNVPCLMLLLFKGG